MKNNFSFLVLLIFILNSCSTSQKVITTTNPVELSESNSSELRFKDITHKINIINKQSRLSILTKDGFIERLAFILEGNDVYYKNLIFGDFNKSFNNIIIDGQVNYIKKNIEGKFQLSIYDDEGQKKFSSPISINNNKLKILFFELDFSKLF